MEHKMTIKLDLCKRIEKDLKDIQIELERLRSRDCNAKIELCYNDGNNPFAREPLNIVDVGVADNIYVVESKKLSDIQSENKEFKEIAQFALDFYTSTDEYLEDKYGVCDTRAKKLLCKKIEEILKKNVKK
jgi:hypothetical protein